MAVYKYLGKDTEHYVGVPARDLDEDEFASLPPEKQADVVNGSLYRVMGKARAEKADDEKPAAPVAKEG